MKYNQYEMLLETMELVQDISFSVTNLQAFEDIKGTKKVRKLAYSRLLNDLNKLQEKVLKAY